MVLPWDLRIAWQHTGREQHFIEGTRGQYVGCRACAEPQRHAGLAQPFAEIAQRLLELCLTRNDLGEVELSADRVRSLEQRHRMAALGERGGGGEPCRAGADHGDAARHRHGTNHEFGLMTGSRIDEAGCQLVGESVVEAGLIAGDAGVDARCTTGSGLAHEVRVREQRPRHGHKIGIA